MASLKFFKGAFTAETNYVQGGVYFDNTSHEIRVGKGAVNSYDVFGSRIKDVKEEEDKLIFSFTNGREDLVIDFSDVASAAAISEALGKLDTRVSNLESKVGSEAASAVYYADYAEYKAAMDAAGETAISESDYNALSDTADEKVKTPAVAASGLVKDVADLKAAVGDTSATDSLGNRVKALEDDTTADDALAKANENADAIGVASTSTEAKDATITEGVSLFTRSGDDPDYEYTAVAADDIVAGGSYYKAGGEAGTYEEAVKDVDYTEPVEASSTDATGLTKRVEDLESASADHALKTDIKVDGIADGDNILTLDGKKIGSSLSMSYETIDEVKYIVLRGKNDVEISKVDATPFIADGMLESAELVDLAEGDVDGLAAGKYFKFAWSGVTEDPVYVPMSAFAVTTYTAGDDLKLTDGRFDVAIPEDIIIAGGPLADDLTAADGTSWSEKNDDGVTVIKAGSSLSDILSALFTKVINGTVSSPVYTWSPSLAAPSASFSVSGVQEVGKNVTVSYSANSTVSSNTAKVSVAASQGYFTAVDGSWSASPYTESVNGTDSGTAVATGKFNNSEVESGASVALVEGTNTLAVSESGITASVADFTAATVYGSTNIKKVLSDVSEDVDVDYFADDKDLTSSKSASLTAYYPIYTNGISHSNGNTTVPDSITSSDDSTKLPLVADATTFTVAFASMAVAPWHLLIQKDKSITSALAIDGLKGTYTSDVKAKFVKGSEVVTKATGDTTAEYYVWEYNGTEGPNCVAFKID